MKEKLQEKIADLKKYQEKLEKYAAYDKEEITSNEETQAAVERYLNLAIEIVIQIGKMIISNEELEKPDTYQDVIKKLGQEEILPKGFAERFAPATGLRNLLIHRYGEIDINKVIETLKNNVEDFNTFSKHVSKYAANLEQ